MRKNYNNNGLKDPLFIGDPEVGSSERHDIKLDEIIYRVWSVFANEGESSDSLADLMQSSIESGNEVGEVRDWQMIELVRAILEGKKILENRVNGLPDDYGLPLEINVY